MMISTTLSIYRDDVNHPEDIVHSRSFDIIASIENLRARGMEFLNIPDSYYNVLRKRLAKSPVKVDRTLYIFIWFSSVHNV